MKTIYCIAVTLIVLTATAYPSLFSTQLPSSGKVYAQVVDNNSQIPLGLPNACVFDDGDSPQDPEECFPIRNNQDTQGVDNIFFTSRSDTTVDRFSCELRDINNNLVDLSQVPDNPSNCFKDPNNAEQQYTNLPDGTYSFQVIAFKTVVVDDDDPTINRQNPIPNEAGLVQVELRGESQAFRFIVGTGGEAGEGGAGVDRGFVDRGDIVEREDILWTVPNNNGKAQFLNLEYILNNNIQANVTSLECFYAVYDDDKSDLFGFRTYDCKNIFVFADKLPTTNSNLNTIAYNNTAYNNTAYNNTAYNNTAYNNTSAFSNMNVFTVKYAISNGITGNLVTCGVTSDPGGPNFVKKNFAHIETCKNYFIAY